MGCSLTSVTLFGTCDVFFEHIHTFSYIACIVIAGTSIVTMHVVSSGKWESFLLPAGLVQAGTGVCIRASVCTCHMPTTHLGGTQWP